MLATGTVLVLFAIDTAPNAPETFTAMIVLGVLAVALDCFWKRVADRRNTPELPVPN